MTTPRALIALGSAAALAIPLLTTPTLARAESAASLLYERTLMDRAGARCRLFTPEIAAALSASGLQARGATLRSGGTAEGVRQIEQRAALKAYATPCNSPDLAVAAKRVRQAFDGYAALRDMTFPGTLSLWSADRKPWPLVANGKVQSGPLWRLFETGDGSGTMTLGMASGPGLVAVTTSGGAGDAAGARLVLRDPAKAPDPFIDTRRSDLSGRTPPRSVTQVFLAQSIGPAPASLLPKGAAAGTMAVFPQAAAEAMAALDPREAVSVEIVRPTRTGERVETTLFEVGDFAAGRAFLAAGR